MLSWAPSCPGPMTCPASSSSSGGSRWPGGRQWRGLRPVKFSVQRGARFDLKEEQLKEVSSKIGKLLRYRLYSRTSNGFDGFLGEWRIFLFALLSVEFECGDIAGSLVNTLVEVGDYELHCSHDPPQLLQQERSRHWRLHAWFHSWQTPPLLHQLQGETPSRFRGFDCSLIVFPRFQDPNPALDLIGSWVKILSSTVWVREVTSQTIPVNTSRVPRSDLPWRKYEGVASATTSFLSC